MHGDPPGCPRHRIRRRSTVRSPHRRFGRVAGRRPGPARQPAVHDIDEGLLPAPFPDATKPKVVLAPAARAAL